MTDGEQERLEALHALRVLDTPPEEAFDDIASLVASRFGTPIALVSLVDDCRQWFKASVGLEARETPREIAFCSIAIQQSKVMVVPDATEDARFRDNPVVLGEPFIRFYAGAPLITAGGFRLGTVCVADSAPRRDFGVRECDDLARFARIAMDQMEQKILNDTLQETEARYRAIFESSLDAMVITDAVGTIQSANPAAERLFGYASVELVGSNVTLLMPPAERAAHPTYLDRYKRTGEKYIIGKRREVEGLRRDGSRISLELSVAEWRSRDGRRHFTGTLRDIGGRCRSFAQE